MTYSGVTDFSRDEGEVSQERVWWIDNMKYWVEGVAVLVLCLAGILGGIGGVYEYKVLVNGY